MLTKAITPVKYDIRIRSSLINFSQRFLRFDSNFQPFCVLVIMGEHFSAEPAENNKKWRRRRMVVTLKPSVTHSIKSAEKSEVGTNWMILQSRLLERTKKRAGLQHPAQRQ